jgi:hypothetical protein
LSPNTCVIQTVCLSPNTCVLQTVCLVTKYMRPQDCLIILKINASSRMFG